MTRGPVRSLRSRGCAHRRQFTVWWHQFTSRVGKSSRDGGGRRCQASGPRMGSRSCRQRRGLDAQWVRTPPGRRECCGGLRAPPKQRWWQRDGTGVKGARRWGPEAGTPPTPHPPASHTGRKAVSTWTVRKWQERALTPTVRLPGICAAVSPLRRFRTLAHGCLGCLRMKWYLVFMPNSFV